jgi:ABC-type polysaccharide/polyol phosphate export permease
MTKRLVYDSAQRKPIAIEEINTLIRYRDLLALMVSNNLKTRYKRSALGVVWTLLNPLINMAVITLAFSHLFRFTLENYPIYILSGLIFWNFFTQSTTNAINNLVWGGALLRRVYVPRTIFSIASVGNGLVNLGLAMLPLIGIVIVLGHPIRLAWLFVPVGILIFAMFALGVSLFVSTLAVYFTDTVDIYQVLIQAWFFLTPIMYSPDILPPEYGWLVKLNPIYTLIELCRQPIYYGVLPDPATMGLALLYSVLALTIGWLMFTARSDDFAYRV